MVRYSSQSKDIGRVVAKNSGGVLSKRLSRAELLPQIMGSTQGEDEQPKDIYNDHEDIVEEKEQELYST